MKLVNCLVLILILSSLGSLLAAHKSSVMRELLFAKPTLAKIINNYQNKLLAIKSLVQDKPANPGYLIAVRDLSQLADIVILEKIMHDLLALEYSEILALDSVQKLAKWQQYIANQLAPELLEQVDLGQPNLVEVEFWLNYLFADSYHELTKMFLATKQASLRQELTRLAAKPKKQVRFNLAKNEIFSYAPEYDLMPFSSFESTKMDDDLDDLFIYEKYAYLKTP